MKKRSKIEGTNLIKFYRLNGYDTNVFDGSPKVT
jgi:hypothetical protein